MHPDCCVASFLLLVFILLGSDRGMAVLHGSDRPPQESHHTQAFPVSRLGWAFSLSNFIYFLSSCAYSPCSSCFSSLFASCFFLLFFFIPFPFFLIVHISSSYIFFFLLFQVTVLFLPSLCFPSCCFTFHYLFILFFTSFYVSCHLPHNLYVKVHFYFLPGLPALVVAISVGFTKAKGYGTSS